MTYRPILSVDFDGVIHSYKSGWKGAHVVPDDPVPGAIEALVGYLDAGFDVAIFSSRSKSLRGRWAMKRWTARHAAAALMEQWDTFMHSPTAAKCVGFAEPETEIGRAFVRCLSWPWFKPSAVLTIDDRAHRFDGHFPTAGWIKDFQPWNKRRRPYVTEDGQVYWEDPLGSAPL